VKIRRFSYAGVLAAVTAATTPLEPALGLRVLRRPGKLVAAIAPVAAVFAAWDVAGFRAGWWHLDVGQTTGAVLPGGLPAEEAAFFVVIPTAAVLTWEAVLARRPQWSPR
jgi:lycopene cyclase domain-containing protein